MGKRELFIALAFIAAGVVAYQLTAPPPKADGSGFSLSRFWTNARRGIRANTAQASFTHAGTLPVPPEAAELRLEGQVVPGRVKVVGESRGDIAYELAVDSTGPDAETALAYAKQVAIRTDDLGRAVTLRVTYPREGRQSATMMLRLPSRLGVLISGASGVEISNVAAVHLDNVSGDCAVSNVTGGVNGVHRNGSLDVADVSSVKLSLQRSRAKFERVEHGLTIDMRDGECHIVESRGPVDLDEARTDVAIDNPGGPIRVGGTDGTISVKNPRAESTVDVRRAEIEVQLSQSVPLTLLTTDEILRVLLDGPPHVTIDAVSNLGRVQASDFDLTPESVEQESRLAHTFGAPGAPRVSLRNLRGDIVIKNFRGAIVNPKRK
jgi:hypothetical protein